MLPALLLDPFDFANTLLSVDYSPPTWLAWAIFGFGLSIAAVGAFHEARMSSVASPVNPNQNVEDAIANLSEFEITAGGQLLSGIDILNALGDGFANGLRVDGLRTELRKRTGILVSRQQADEITSQLVVRQIVRSEYRQPAQAGPSGTYQSLAAVPYTIYYLTELGSRSVSVVWDRFGRFERQPRQPVAIEQADPTPRCETYDGVVWQDKGRKYANSEELEIDGPFCPSDYTTLSYRDRAGTSYPEFADRAEVGYKGILFCSQCGKNYDLGGHSKSVGQSRGEVTNIFEGKRRREKLDSTQSKG